MTTSESTGHIEADRIGPADAFWPLSASRSLPGLRSENASNQACVPEGTADRKGNHMDTSQRHGSKNRILSKEQISRVNEYAFRLMEEIGCKILCDEALDILGNAGCDVSQPDRVRIPRRLVMEALEAAAKEIEVYNRDGELSMTFKEDSCYYGTGSDCPTTIDLYSGERRRCAKEDVGRLARTNPVG